MCLFYQPSQHTYLDEGEEGLAILGMEGTLDLLHVLLTPGHHDAVEGVLVSSRSLHGLVQLLRKVAGTVLAASN